MRYRITVGPPGAPAEGKDRLVARPRKRHTALERGDLIAAENPTENVWVWEENRPNSWHCIGGAQGSPDRKKRITQIRVGRR